MKKRIADQVNFQKNMLINKKIYLKKLIKNYVFLKKQFFIKKIDN